MSDQDNFKGNPFAGGDGDNFEGDPFASGAAPAAPKRQTLKQTLEEQTKGDLGTALETGIANATSRVVHGVGQLLPEKATRFLEQHGVMPTQRDIDLLEAGTAAAPAARAAQIGGDVAMSALPIAKAGQAGRLLSSTLAKAPAAIPLAAETAGAAGYGALTADEGEGGKGAAWGAGGNLAGAALAKALRGVVTPTAEARLLLDKGVSLTPGQAAGTGSFAKKAEELGASLPVASHYVKAAQRRAVEDANIAAAQSVADIVSKETKLGRPVREAIEQTRDLVSKTYDNALEGMTVPGFVPEVQLSKVVQQAAADYPMMEQHQIAQMGRYVSQRIGQMVKANGGILDGPTMKQLDSEIGGQIRNLRNSTNAADKTAAPAWADLQQTLRDTMANAQGDPVKQAALQKANAAYRQLLAMEKTLLPGADTFTPRRLTATLDKMGIKGTELNTISKAMTETLPNQVPSSGTAERLLTAGLPAMLMGGGAGAQNMGWDTLGTGMMIAGAMGSRPGARMMMGATAPQRFLVNSPNAAAAAVRALRRGGPAGMVAGQKKEQQPEQDNEAFLRKIGAIK